jgi:MFS family permease
MAGALPRGRGVWWFAGAGVVNAVGTGFFYPYQLLFFRELLRVPLVVVGAGLTLAIFLALPLLPTIGRLVDRVGPRRVLVVAALVRAGAFVGYLQVDGVVAFVAFSVLVAAGSRAEQVATPVLAAAAAPVGQTPAWLALTRVVFNAGVGAGGLLAAVMLAQAPTAVTVVGWANAVSFLLAALMYLPLPAGRVTGQEPAGRTRPWRHTLFRQLALARFLLLVVLLAVEVAVPVYTVERLGWPVWTVGAMFAVMTAIVLVFQLPAGSRLRRYRTMPVVAMGAALHGALLIALGVAASLDPIAQIVVLATGALLYALGGIIASQALMVALVAVPPPPELGEYQAFTQVLVGVALAVVPLVASVFLDHWPVGLWWLLLLVVGYVALDMLTHNRRHATGRHAAELCVHNRLDPVTVTGDRTMDNHDSRPA